MSRGRPAHFSNAVMSTLERGEYTARQIAELNQASYRPIYKAVEYLASLGRIAIVGRAESTGGKPPAIFGRAIEPASNTDLRRLHSALARR